MISWIKKPYVILGVGVGVGIVAFIRIYGRKNNDIVLRTESDRISRSINVPKGFVGYVLGRGGATIKDIRAKTKARITLDDAGQDFTVATVTGSPDSVEEAVNMINTILTNRPACVSREIEIKNSISDTVLKNINCIMQICNLTRAKIIFEFLPSKKGNSPIKISIKGKREEVDSAVELIDEFIADIEVNMKKPQTHVAGRALPDNWLADSMKKAMIREKLVLDARDGYAQVFVSAIESPSKFWVQNSGIKARQLDKLCTEMTDFYDDEENKTKYRPLKINIGEIVVARCDEDNSWYRSQIQDIGEDCFTVLYIDFGDTAVLKPDKICVLKSEFLSIPFQAIECRLGGVSPVGDNGWSSEAIDTFEKLVYLGRWKVIMAKYVSVSNDNKAKNNDSVEEIALIDTLSEIDIDIAEELVKRGFATQIVEE